MTRTKAEDLALLVLRLADTYDLRLIKEARELAHKVLADHVVQDIVSGGPVPDGCCGLCASYTCNGRCFK